MKRILVQETRRITKERRNFYGNLSWMFNMP